MADDECIVLGDSSDDEQQAVPVAKRARGDASAAADGDVEFVDAQPAPLLADDGADDGGSDDDDEVRVVGTKGEVRRAATRGPAALRVLTLRCAGQTALKDFPHPRSACLNFPFALTHHKLSCAKFVSRNPSSSLLDADADTQVLLLRVRHTGVRVRVLGRWCVCAAAPRPLCAFPPCL